MGIFNFWKRKNTNEEKDSTEFVEKEISNSIRVIEDGSVHEIINEKIEIEQSNELIEPELNEFTQHMINESLECIEHFQKRYGNKFDFSENSLQLIDAILEDVGEFKEDMEEEQIQWVVEKIGAYIFEVARKNYGGNYFWYNERKQPIFVSGLPEFEISLLSFDKVKGRIDNGYEDNIPYFFQGYSDRVKKGKPGDKAMIV